VTIEGDAAGFVERARTQGIELRARDPLDASEWLVSLPEGTPPTAILRVALQSGVRVRRFVPRRASLEEVFLETLEGAGGAR
jgi:hypothetical protein